MGGEVKSVLTFSSFVNQSPLGSFKIKIMNRVVALLVYLFLLVGMLLMHIGLIFVGTLCPMTLYYTTYGTLLLYTYAKLNLTECAIEKQRCQKQFDKKSIHVLQIIRKVRELEPFNPFIHRYYFRYLLIC